MKKLATLVLSLTILSTNAQARFLSCSLNGQIQSIDFSEISDFPQVLVGDSSFEVKVLEGDLGTMIFLTNLDNRATAITEATLDQLSGNNTVSLGLESASTVGYVNCQIRLEAAVP